MQINFLVRQLRAFLSLVELRSFTKAAEATHLSQPAFSAMISTMEQAIGARLFHRDTRNVELTNEGQLFEASARRALAEIELGLGGVRDLVERRRGRVCIALLPSLAAGWLPPLLTRFQASYPGVEFSVADLLSERCIDRVRSGRADFGIVAIPAEDSELTSSHYCTDRFDLVLRRDHRLADAASIAVKDLAGERLIHQSRYSILRRYLEAKGPAQQASLTAEVEQLATVIGMVRAGLGIAAIPRLNLFDFHYPDLVRRELHWPGLERSLHVVRLRNRPFTAAAEALHELVLQNRPAPAAPVPAARKRRRDGRDAARAP